MPSRRLIKDPERYKTVLCATWTSTGECPYGRKCQFAHGKEELRARVTTAVPTQRLPGMPGAPLNVVMGLPQPPLPMWPSGPSSLPTHLGMPPLPAGPPPPMPPLAPLGQPPLPPGPPPSMSLSGTAGYGATSQLGAFASQQQQQQQQQRTTDGLHAFACAPCAEPIMPGALLSACAPAAAPATTTPLPSALLPSAALPAMAPLPLPAAAAPTAERPFASAPAAAMPTMPAVPAVPAAGAHVPPGAVPPKLSLSMGDELACFAMQCHLAEQDTCAGDIKPLTGAVGDGRPPRIWTQAAPLGDLSLNPVSGKVEALDGPLDSPLEPGLPGAKKDVSFSTMLVRRAVSFIFDDPSGIGEPRLPSALASPRLATASPGAAIAA